MACMHSLRSDLGLILGLSGGRFYIGTAIYITMTSITAGDLPITKQHL